MYLGKFAIRKNLKKGKEHLGRKKRLLLQKEKKAKKGGMIKLVKIRRARKQRFDAKQHKIRKEGDTNESTACSGS